MSSDSDDIDEDELLQIALKEQAQRDLNYPQNQRKPVVNYVQPPVQRPAQRSGSSSNSSVPVKKSVEEKSGRRGSGGRVGVEEDDDSEVEMLSISSGDEESSIDKVVGGKGGRGRGAKGSKGRNESKGDKDWDGEEADCWKRVDEDEVCLTFLL